MKRAADHCRQILNYVNQAVREAENKQVRREEQEGSGRHVKSVLSRIWESLRRDHCVIEGQDRSLFMSWVGPHQFEIGHRSCV